MRLEMRRDCTAEPPGELTMIATVSPIVTIGLAIAILDEPFTLADGLGSALVLLGVGLFTWGDSRAKRAPAAGAGSVPAPAAAQASEP